MKKKILVIQHVSRKQPGCIFSELQKNGIDFDVVDFSAGDDVPDSTREYGALIVLGGVESAADDTEKMKSEIAFVEAWLKTGKPYLGICLGMQILARAGGGVVKKGACTEIGFRDQEQDIHSVTLTPAGKQDPFLRGTPALFQIFALHDDTVDLEKRTVLLGKGNHCDNQIIRVGANAYGTQFHFELTRGMFDVWVVEHDGLKALNRDMIEKDFNEFSKECERIGKQLFHNFLHFIV